jgi:hypothetical protein
MLLSVVNRNYRQEVHDAVHNEKQRRKETTNLKNKMNIV